jgi:hypothetical protein
MFVPRHAHFHGFLWFSFSKLWKWHVCVRNIMNVWLRIGSLGLWVGWRSSVTSSRAGRTRICSNLANSKLGTPLSTRICAFYTRSMEWNASVPCLSVLYIRRSVLKDLGTRMGLCGFISFAERVNVVLGIYKHYPWSMRCMLAYIHFVCMHRGRCIGPNKKYLRFGLPTDRPLLWLWSVLLLTALPVPGPGMEAYHGPTRSPRRPPMPCHAMPCRPDRRP